jgi:sugar/nucleoside kinase (ribokinase family)
MKGPFLGGATTTTSAGGGHTGRLKPHRLVVVGTVLVDILLYFDRLPEPGAAGIAAGSVVSAGAGYNLLAGAQRLGLPAAFAGLAGRGPFGTLVRSALDGIGVPILLPARDEDTGFDIGLVETSSGRQPTFLGAPGVESTLQLPDLRSITLAPGDAIYLSGYDLWYPEQGHALAVWLSELGPEYLFVFDPGPLIGEIAAARLDATIARADILSLNTAEAAVLTGERSETDQAERLAREVPPGGWVTVRAGADGCWVAPHRGPARHLPARPTTPVDTTGAGDAYLSALLARLAAGDEFPRAAQWANLAASLAIERPGPATSPSAEELVQAAGNWHCPG